LISDKQRIFIADPDALECAAIGYVEHFDIKVTISVRYDISNRCIDSLDRLYRSNTSFCTLHWKLM